MSRLQLRRRAAIVGTSTELEWQSETIKLADTWYSAFIRRIGSLDGQKIDIRSVDSHATPWNTKIDRTREYGNQWNHYFDLHTCVVKVFIVVKRESDRLNQAAIDVSLAEVIGVTSTLIAIDDINCAVWRYWRRIEQSLWLRSTDNPAQIKLYRVWEHVYRRLRHEIKVRCHV